MEKCFVIQPFDNGKYDKRYEDIFGPAIQKANLEPYRIDKDLSVRIPIDEIEKGIIESAVCFAEITTDNPNVWYELGFAFACGKEVIMICSDERADGKFPFDIQHRHIITYKTSSKSDFEELENKITRKILAVRKKTKTIETLQESPVVATEGLKSHEIAILICLGENQFTEDSGTSIQNIKNEMGKAGYTDIATMIGIKMLSRKDFVKVFMTQDDWNSYDYPAAKLTAKGENWLLENQDQLEFRKEKASSNQYPNSVDDLPF